jgi:hypothetical protein
MVYEDDEDTNARDERSLMSFKTNFIISYYNIAFQLQQVARRDEALEVVTQGRQFSEMELGENHQLTYELGRLSDQLVEELTKNAAMKHRPGGTLLGRKKMETYNEYKNWMNANQVQGIEYNLDNTGRHFLKFNKFKNEVSIETEPSLVPKRRFGGKIRTRLTTRETDPREKYGDPKKSNVRLPPISYAGVRGASNNSIRSKSYNIDKRSPKGGSKDNYNVGGGKGQNHSFNGHFGKFPNF